MNVLGWLFGVLLGVILVLAGAVAIGLSIPAALAGIASVVGIVVGTLSPPLTIAMVLVLIVLLYLWAYAFATVSVAPSLPFVTLPLTGPILTPTGAPVVVTGVPGELFARGMMAGLTASLNAGLIGAIPIPVIAGTWALWAFVIISVVGLFPVLAMTRGYQGFLGWSAWLFPMSYPATVVGLLLFLANLPVVLTTPGLGIAAIRIDFTTGVVETAGGLSGITGFAGGFSLGNFTFVVTQPPTPALGEQGPFAGQSISSHETGHSLNTAAFGGIVLWINAIDENVPPFARFNLAYGELTAESHARSMPGPAFGGYSLASSFSVDIWG